VLIVWNIACGIILEILAFSFRLFRYLCCTLGSKPRLFTSEQLGQQAELLAARFFMRRGYSVLGRRERLKGAELDLILVDHFHRDDELVVVEVKASHNASALPHRRFTFRKRERIRLATNEFIGQYKLKGVCIRLELVTVIWSQQGLLPTIRRFRLESIQTEVRSR